METIKISIPHFYCLEYEVGDKKMFIDIDFREKKILFGKKLIKSWEEPYSAETISEEEKEEIFDNIMQFLLENYYKSNIINIG